MQNQIKPNMEVTEKISSLENPVFLRKGLFDLMFFNSPELFLYILWFTISFDGIYIFKDWVGFDVLVR